MIFMNSNFAAYMYVSMYSKKYLVRELWQISLTRKYMY